MGDFFNLIRAWHGAVAEGIIWSVMTLGVYITFRILDFPDLSVDGSFVTGGAVAAMFVAYLNVNPFLALLASLAAGMLCGLITGFINTKMKIPGILSGIITMTALYSINFRIMNNSSTVALIGTNTVDVVVRDFFRGISAVNAQLIIGGVLALALIAFLYWFFGTELGSSIRATGNNPHMARSLGINTDSTVMVALMLSNGLVALSGGVFAHVQGSSSLSSGPGTIAIGLASVIIGEVVLGKKLGFILRLSAMVVGTVIYRLIFATVLFAGLKATDMKLISALVVCFALYLPTARKRFVSWQTRKRGRVPQLGLVPDAVMEDIIDGSDKDPDEPNLHD
ncbi:MAG: ABC transporter permease [Oscillospiraceae bacterium]|jgi:putative ABC transport system permease protein|nr:ABC transporter permease [Oscillospiraceae bacterium]